jgi:tRNA A-37 threonylcarbamoyl transferase component Bud32
MKLITGTAEKPRIVLDPDNQIIKFIHKNKYAKRIKKNAAKLDKLSIPSINIIDEQVINSRHAIIYPKIPGITVEEFINKGNYIILKKVALFLSKLHMSGVYLADPHLNNILRQDNDVLAVIDLESIKILHAPLSLNKRALNLCRLIKKSLNSINKLGIADFLKTYLAAAALSESRKNKLCALLIKKLYKEYINPMQQNTEKLSRLGIAGIAPVMHISPIDNSDIDIILPKISGIPISQLMHNGDNDILPEIAKFIAYLHNHGVYNPSWVFRNILLQDNGKFAFKNNRRLKVYNHPLSPRKRIRNLKLLIEQQHKVIKDFGLKRFVEIYLAAAKCSDAAISMISTALSRL